MSSARKISKKYKAVWIALAVLMIISMFSTLIAASFVR